MSNAFQLLSKCFWRVVWVPGNHCVWLRPDLRDGSTYPDSLAKLMALRQVRPSKAVLTPIMWGSRVEATAWWHAQAWAAPFQLAKP